MFEIMLLKINYHKVVGSLMLLFPLLLTVQATPLLWSEQLLWLENFVIAGGVLLVMASVLLSGGLACRPMVGVCYVARLFAIVLSLLL